MSKEVETRAGEMMAQLAEILLGEHDDSKPKSRPMAMEPVSQGSYGKRRGREGEKDGPVVRVLAALTEDQSGFPATMLGSLQLLVIPVASGFNSTGPSTRMHEREVGAGSI